MNKIGYNVVIEDGAIIGDNNIIGGNTIIKSNVVIGDNNTIGSSTIIGGKAEIYDYIENFKQKVIIGDNNTINHQVTIDGSSINDATIIGNNCMLMSKTHIGHDVEVGNSVIISTGSKIGGFTKIHNHTNIGLNSVIHQRLVIGGHVMVGMGSVVTKNVEPFCTIIGSPAKFMKLNTYGLLKKKLIQSHDELIAFLICNEPFVLNINNKFYGDLLDNNKLIKRITQ